MKLNLSKEWYQEAGESDECTSVAAGTLNLNALIAASSHQKQVIILDTDVAQVFANSEQVNSVLRALIATMPKTAAG